MAREINDPWGQGSGIFADQIFEPEPVENSSPDLLDSYGRAIKRVTMRRQIGFDLRGASVFAKESE